MVKYRLAKVKDRHFPRSNYTDFQLVENPDYSDEACESPRTWRKRRRPIGRMKLHSKQALAQEFRRCTNGSVMQPATESVIRGLSVPALGSEEEEEEKDYLILDPVPDPAPSTERDTRDTDSGIGQCEMSGTVEQRPQRGETQNRAQQNQNELDEFFEIEDNQTKKCVKVEEEKNPKPNCQKIDTDSSDSDFEADVTKKEDNNDKPVCTEIKSESEKPNQVSENSSNAAKKLGEKDGKTESSGKDAGSQDPAKVTKEESAKVSKDKPAKPPRKTRSPTLASNKTPDQTIVCAATVEKRPRIEHKVSIPAPDKDSATEEEISTETIGKTAVQEEACEKQNAVLDKAKLKETEEPDREKTYSPNSEKLAAVEKNTATKEHNVTEKPVATKGFSNPIDDGKATLPETHVSKEALPVKKTLPQKPAVKNTTMEAQPNNVTKEVPVSGTPVEKPKAEKQTEGNDPEKVHPNSERKIANHNLEGNDISEKSVTSTYNKDTITEKIADKASDAKQVSLDAKPTSVEAKPVSLDAKPTSVDSKPILGDTKPAVVDNKSISVDSKTASVDAKPASVDAKPASVNDKPASPNAKPALVNDKPASANNKPDKGSGTEQSSSVEKCKDKDLEKSDTESVKSIIKITGHDKSEKSVTFSENQKKQ